MPDETEALRAEVAELRTELENLRAWRDSHICAPVTGQCTCGTSARCPVHAPPCWHGTTTTTLLPWTNVCAGAAAAPVYTYMVPSAGTAAAPATLTVGPLHYNTMGAAPAPQIFTYNVGGECA